MTDFHLRDICHWGFGGGADRGNWYVTACPSNILLPTTRGLSRCLISQKDSFLWLLQDLLHLSVFFVQIFQNHLGKPSFFPHVLHTVFKTLAVVTPSKLVNRDP